jgi:small-conductance mechanosensitive channel
MLDKIVYGNVTVLNLIVAVAIIIAAIIIDKLLTLRLKKLLKDKINKAQVEVISKVVYYLVIAVAILVVLSILGIQPSGLLVAGGIAGIVIGFASQSIVGNLVSGIFLIIERPIKIGNVVNIDGVTGYVEDIRIVSTTIRTYDGIYVRIPNEKVFTTNIVNYFANAARRFEYIVGIRYSDDADKAIKIIRELVDAEPLALKNPKPQVFVKNLGDNAVNIVVRPWAPSTHWYNLRMELLWKVKKTLEENDIEIAFPQRTLWFANKLKS